MQDESRLAIKGTGLCSMCMVELISLGASTSIGINCKDMQGSLKLEFLLGQYGTRLKSTKNNANVVQ